MELDEEFHSTHEEVLERFFRLFESVHRCVLLQIAILFWRCGCVDTPFVLRTRVCMSMDGCCLWVAHKGADGVFVYPLLTVMASDYPWVCLCDMRVTTCVVRPPSPSGQVRHGLPEVPRGPVHGLLRGEQCGQRAAGCGREAPHVRGPVPPGRHTALHGPQGGTRVLLHACCDTHAVTRML